MKIELNVYVRIKWLPYLFLPQLHLNILKLIHDCLFRVCETDSVLSLIAFDLGSSFFFNEEYIDSTECFNLYFQYSAGLSNLQASDINVSLLP